MAWYQLAKSRMKKTIEKNGDLTPILEGIEELNKRVLTKPRQINDRSVSLEAMERFIALKLPSFLKDVNYEVLKNLQQSR